MKPTDNPVYIRSLANHAMKGIRGKPHESRREFKRLVKDWPYDLKINAIKIYLEHAAQQGKAIPKPRKMLIRNGYVDWPVKQSDLAIVQVVAGRSFEHEHDETRDRVKAYAAQCGADYVLLEGDEFPLWPMANKFRIHEVFKRYQRTLYLDVDIVIRPGAPNIFDEVPAGFVGLHNEYADTVDHGDEARQGHRDLITNSQRLDRQLIDNTVVNGGVMLVPRRYADVYAPPTYPLPTHHVADQSWLSASIVAQGVPVHWLDSRWNCESIAPDFWDRVGDAYFAHLNGTRPLHYRLELLKRMKAGDFARLTPEEETTFKPAWIESP